MSIYNYKELYEMWKESAPQTDDRVALNEDWGIFVDSYVRSGKVSQLMWQYLPTFDDIPESTQEYLEEMTGMDVDSVWFELIVQGDGVIYTELQCGNCDEIHMVEGDVISYTVRCPNCETLNQVE